MVRLRASISIVLAALTVSLTGCASLERNPVPLELADRATVLGPQRVRFWGDEKPKNIAAFVAERQKQFRKTRPEMVRRGSRPKVAFLALSGGGADGAYGAGLLVGWTAAGTRPQFDLVTGISTGSLAAPFAFLGSAYDRQLKEIYTQYATRDLIKERPIRGLLGGTSLASSEPLANLIARYVDRDLMAEIARQHERGRRLFIGTTNLDAQRPVIWDMGRIATSGHPEALALFRKVLLASAAIPGAFPPVRMPVDAEGATREEMHVDGGAAKQVFLFPSQLMLPTDIDRRTGVHPRRSLYIIRNGRLDPEYKVVGASTLSIAQRSISTLIKTQGIGDLYRLYGTAKRNRIKYNLAYIPGDFPDDSTEAFDPKYMTRLFNLGYEKAQKGYRWTRTPPGFGSR